MNQTEEKQKSIAYGILFNVITDCIETLHKVQSDLIKAQKLAEELHIEFPHTKLNVLEENSCTKS